jgi:hypothetical protein
MTSLGRVTGLDVTKDAGLFQQPIPRQDSTEAIVMDIFGVARNITLTGTFVDTEANCITFIGQIDALCDGQQPLRQFHSDISSATYNVFIMSLNWKYSAGELGKIDYTITMIEASTSS